MEDELSAGGRGVDSLGQREEARQRSVAAAAGRPLTVTVVIPETWPAGSARAQVLRVRWVTDTSTVLLRTDATEADLAAALGLLRASRARAGDDLPATTRLTLQAVPGGVPYGPDVSAALARARAAAPGPVAGPGVARTATYRLSPGA